MNAEILEKVQLWQEHLTDPELKEELDALVAAGDEDKLFDAFYRSLAFGTAGLRGVLGVGTNRMNIHVVAQATQGLADYLNAHYENPTVAIARDSRLHGEDFQKVAAGVLAANGIHVFVYPRIEPVPTLSFAVRYLKTSAGIVLTASHNPAPYNGYKVYNDNGGQIANEAADEISANIAKVDIFDDVRCMDFDEALEKGLVEWTPEEVLDAFIAAVRYSSAGTTPEIPAVRSPSSRALRAPQQRITASKSAVSRAAETSFPTSVPQRNPIPSASIFSIRRRTTLLSSFMAGMPYISRPPGRSSRSSTGTLWPRRLS